MSQVEQYINDIKKEFNTGIAKEHSYRPALKELIESFNKITAVNEPKQVECGAPDFIIQNNDKIAIGYIESKDIDKDLNSKAFKEQFDRYINGLDNLIITNYLNFKYYIKGSLKYEVKIAEIINGKIKAITENHNNFKVMINDFLKHRSQTIKSASDLANMMDSNALILSDVINLG